MLIESQVYSEKRMVGGKRKWQSFKKWPTKLSELQFLRNLSVMEVFFTNYFSSVKLFYWLLFLKMRDTAAFLSEY